MINKTVNSSKKRDSYKLLNENDEKFTSKEYDILEKNRNFYSNRKWLNIMLNIINGDSEISIRVLDWFVANFSKKNDTCYKIRLNGRESYFNVHNAYKNQLNGYSKQYFDPFCRKRKIEYSYINEDKVVVAFETSIGQLNFFQWAIINKIIKYVEKNLKEIEKDMKETNKKNKEKKTFLQSSRGSDKSNSIETIISDDPDPVICSSDKINNIHISPINRSSSNKTDSETRHKRQQLSKSVYDDGIKKSNVSITLDFE